MIRGNTYGLDVSRNVSVSSVEEYLANDNRRGFQVGSSYFVRFAIAYDESKSQTFAVLTIHHALYDGWTLVFKQALGGTTQLSKCGGLH